ncbi:MAG: PEGA domain-containing protein [Candidatus Omnitrophica bacterium]|nr:PEGA domain-containing protein [Candidatus Omnitrophota bacterium]
MFIKTGALYLNTDPVGATIYVNGKKVPATSPTTLRYVLPKIYQVQFEKEGYYSYKKNVAVRQSRVTELDVMLIPIVTTFECLNENFEVYRFFFSKKFLDKKIILFTSEGIYYADFSFASVMQITKEVLPRKVAFTLNDAIEVNDNILLFWDDRHVYSVTVPHDDEPLVRRETIETLYATKEKIHNLYLGFKEHYAIIHEGDQINVIDIHNNGIIFPMVQLKDKNAQVFYDTREEILYFTDYDQGQEKYVLHKKKCKEDLLSRLESFRYERGNEKEIA